MEAWLLYGLIAAIFIGSRDVFTKHFSTKYTTTEHLIYYYVLCGICIAIYTLYKKILCP